MGYVGRVKQETFDDTIRKSSSLCEIAFFFRIYGKKDGMNEMKIDD